MAGKPLIDYLNISPRMVEMLLSFYQHNYFCHYGHYITTANALVNRGLVSFTEGKGFKITETGRKIAEIIMEE